MPFRSGHCVYEVIECYIRLHVAIFFTSDSAVIPLFSTIFRIRIFGQIVERIENLHEKKKAKENSQWKTSSP